ncbi:MAG: VWA domain-containing protein [Candidatus Eisenbacteria bacterium]|nr:VWA domain-containing protein [Candidatus Eisenbacteria bacterium]
MKFRYSEWDDALADMLRQFETLRSLFNHLLLQTDGDVEEAFRWLEFLKQKGILPPGFDLDAFRAEMEKQDIIRQEGDRAVLTKKGERSIRQESLDLIFGQLRKGAGGEHRTSHTGEGSETLPESRAYVFGDSIADLDQIQTIRSALRHGLDDINITEDDLQVHEKEMRTSVATVLCLDISHSMILYGEDRITPAKRVALALSELILTRYPKDSLDILLFGDDARVVPLEELTYSGVGPYHTNTKAALQLAQRILRTKKHVQKQIFMITDGKPSAMFEEGRLYKNSIGLDPKIVNRTLDEAVACRRKNIAITTFMVAQDHALVEFVEEMTRLNKGRAYYTGLDNLGGYVFADFVRNRRRVVR